MNEPFLHQRSFPPSTPMRRTRRVRYLFIPLYLLTALDGTAQTKWFKYEGNPILDLGPKGSWEERSVDIFQVMLEDGKYRAWYSGNDGTHRRIGYASSPDGIVWTKHPKPVIDLGADGTWDWREVATGHVLHVSSKYLMWYHGYDGSLSRIGYAESRDGVVWNKAYEANPVLTAGPSDFDMLSVGFPDVLNDDQGGFKMWYSGYSEGVRVQIGYAWGQTGQTWTKYPSPVLSTSAPGTWDDRALLFPKVLHTGALYEMWYAGSRGVYTTARTGYAVSSDGIHWTKDTGNPVLTTGPPGSWDGKATAVGEVLLDGDLYRMWYVGFDGIAGRSGYAVSPKGTRVDVSADGNYVAPGRDTVWISVRVADPSGLSFSAEIESAEGYPVDSVALFDDGIHGDGLPGDGMFANRWLPKEERHYSVDLTLSLRQKSNLRFRLDNAASFTTVGPVKVNNVLFMNEATPKPGDTVFIKLALENRGSLEDADSVSAGISTANKWVSELSSISPVYRTVGAGTTSTTDGYYRFFVSPNCPVNTDIQFEVEISSSRIPRWHDAFVVSVLPPWWRSKWAYGFYVLALGGFFFGFRMAEVRRLRLKHQREMERFQAENLRELDQLKSRFFANISHEFRTPLTLIRGPVEQMLSGEFKGDPRDQYEMIIRNSRRLERLVNQLLDLSKIESGKMGLRVQQQDIRQMVRGIASTFESLAANKGIEYRINCPDEPIIGWFDNDAVDKILINLLSNAFKFTAEGGEVSISLEIALQEGGIRDPLVRISVADTGVGIHADQLDKIFDRFYQVDASQTREQEGTGIGLALTKELVDLHRGTISVTSAPGKGSTFIVELPLGKEHFSPHDIVDVGETETTRTRPDIEDVEPARTEQERTADEGLPLLLVVEDNADMRQYIRRCLEDEYRVTEAVNGEEGIENAIEAIPDLIICDVMMPKISGFEVCKRLKTDERTNHIPVILLTAKAGISNKLEGLETGADDYVTKPFDAKELLARVKNLIDQRRRLREKFRQEFVLQPKDVPLQSVDAVFLSKAIDVIESHLSDPRFDTAALAEEASMSRMQLHRKLRAITNLGPGELIRSFRMRRAAFLLEQKAGNVSEVAYEVGYNNPSHFAHAFREYFGVAPSEYPQSGETPQK